MTTTACPCWLGPPYPHATPKHCCFRDGDGRCCPPPAGYRHRKGCHCITCHPDGCLECNQWEAA